MGKPLNFLSQLRTWCLAQHPFGHGFPVPFEELAVAPAFRPLPLRGCLPACLPQPGGALTPAIPHQGLRCGPRDFPSWLFKALSHALGAQERLRPADTRKPQAPPSRALSSESLQLPFPGCLHCSSSGHLLRDGAHSLSPMPITGSQPRATLVLQEPQLPGADGCPSQSLQS